MGYLVLARKYRPQTFSEIVSQEHVVTTLVNAVQSKRMAHAILFSGPRGVGKTTIARILAKAMNCETGPSATPCNQCRSCLEITAGNAADVFEIDGASNNGVDQIRELRDNIKYLPSHSPYKIYIIDEVHMLSIQAFNALLKTLEEPPAHIMFFFATTEAKKIPITIQSRCQRHDLKRIDFSVIKAHLKKLCDQEQAFIDDDALNLITGACGGSMRDALSILDHVITCAEDHVTGSQVMDILGLIDRRKLFDISQAIFSGEISTVLNKLDEIYDLGYDMQILLGDLIQHFRNLLLVKIGKNIDRLVELPENEIALMKQQVQDVSEIHINRILEALFKEEPVIKLSHYPKVALEVLIVRLLQIKPILPIDTLIEKIDRLRTEIHHQPAGIPVSAPASVPERSYKPVQANIHEQAQSVNQRFSSVHEPQTPEILPSSSDPVLPQISVDDPQGFWTCLQDVVFKTSPSLGVLLKQCQLIELTDSGLDIKLSGREYDLKQMEKKKNLLLDACRQILHKELKLNITAETETSQDVKVMKNKSEQISQEVFHHPLVEKTVSLFKGRVVDINPLTPP